jgi:8-oxo-dGTP pyrophosphatase MutT (NUDIX family)
MSSVSPTSDELGAPVTPRPASATALLRDCPGGGVEVFMVRRHVQSEFVPDVYVFPGGSVKEDDLVAEQAPGLCDGASDAETALGLGFRAAAIRELFEEAGALVALREGAPLELAADDHPRFAAYRDALNQRTLTLQAIATQESLTLATASLLRWAHWVTPEAMPKRFDTHFFLVEAPVGQEPAHDALEVMHSLWVTPEDALAGHRLGDFPIVFATIHQLEELTGLASVAEARARFTGRPITTIRPRVVRRNGEPVILMPGEPDEPDEA